MAMTATLHFSEPTSGTFYLFASEHFVSIRYRLRSTTSTLIRS